jgi:hypothetical protein
MTMTTSLHLCRLVVPKLEILVQLPVLPNPNLHKNPEVVKVPRKSAVVVDAAKLAVVVANSAHQ